MPKYTLAALVAALLLFLPSPASAAVGDVVYGPCKQLEAPARCGRITVPLVRGNPGLGTTEVAFALVTRHDASTPSQGTIAYNPGGPGGVSINRGDDLVGSAFSSLIDHRDVLLIDVRGTGQSNVLSCDAVSPLLVFGDAIAAAGVCGNQLGARTAGYSAAAAADDMDDIRAALGIDKLDLWGDSWGTQLMPVYAALHPTHVRSIVLSGAYPIDFDPWGRNQIAAARRAIRLECSRTGRCNGRDVLRDTAKLAKRLRQNPVPYKLRVGDRRVRVELGEDDLANDLYAPFDPAVYGVFPAAVKSGLAGDFGPLKRLSAKTLATSSSLFGQDPQTLSIFSAANNFAIGCHDYPRVYSFADPVPVRKATYQAALGALDRRDFYPVSPEAWTQTGVEGADACIEWPNDPTAGRAIPAGTPMPDVPVLVMNGDFDANTPSSMARQAAAQFAHAQFAEVPNVGHTPTDTECGSAMAARFVKQLTTNVKACAGTGTPPAYVDSPPTSIDDVRPTTGSGTPAQRRALGLVLLTVRDLSDATDVLDLWGTAAGLRGGQYASADDEGSFALKRVRIVDHARVSGELALGDGKVSGSVRLTGSGVLNGKLEIHLTGSAAGTATGVLGGQDVSLTFG